MTTLKLRIKVKEVTTKDGKKFNVFETVGTKGIKITVKFRKEVKNIPSEDSYIVVPLDKVNYARNTIYPTVWVHEIKKVIPLETEKRIDKELLELFDIEPDNDSNDDLPF